MHTLATQFLTAKLYAHRAHHLVSGPTFFADHEFLGDLYDAYDAAYDDLVEQMIGLGEKPDIIAITGSAYNAFAKAKLDTKPEQFFKTLLNMERQIQASIKRLVPGATDGTANLLQGLAQDSEKRANYKMQQRVS